MLTDVEKCFETMLKVIAKETPHQEGSQEDRYLTSIKDNIEMYLFEESSLDFQRQLLGDWVLEGVFKVITLFLYAWYNGYLNQRKISDSFLKSLSEIDSCLFSENETHDLFSLIASSISSLQHLIINEAAVRKISVIN